MPDATCPVLQYAGDMLLLLKAKCQDVTALKQALNDFSNATSLHINFAKSTAIPLHVNDTLAAQMVSILGCKQDSFPQVYLGLSLSNEKLPLSAFAPLICKIDCYLSGWKAELLNTLGRTVLVNAVLDSLLTYLMSAIMLPLGLVDIVDTKRRAFLWFREDTTNGASLSSGVGQSVHIQGVRWPWRQGDCFTKPMPTT